LQVEHSAEKDGRALRPGRLDREEKKGQEKPEGLPERDRLVRGVPIYQSLISCEKTSL
jgi:hypothetical protein